MQNGFKRTAVDIFEHNDEPNVADCLDTKRTPDTVMLKRDAYFKFLGKSNRIDWIITILFLESFEDESLSVACGRIYFCRSVRRTINRCNISELMGE